MLYSTYNMLCTYQCVGLHSKWTFDIMFFLIERFFLYGPRKNVISRVYCISDSKLLHRPVNFINKYSIVQWNSHNFTSDNRTHRVTSPLNGGPVFFLYFTTKLTSYYFTHFAWTLCRTHTAVYQDDRIWA